LSELTEGGVDLLITSGGVSAGDFDLVKQVLRELGEIETWRVRMKPGRPLAFGRLGVTPVLGLPGNPVAAMVSFLQFARPAILTMLGLTDSRRDLVEIPVTVLDEVHNPGGRRMFARVVVRLNPGEFTARLAGTQRSADVASFARANGLLVIPETIARVQPGMRLAAQMPGWSNE
jgi:molybdopterin molybdotransferase